MATKVKLSNTGSARIYHTQQVHYLHRTFRFNDNDPATLSPGYNLVGVLPAHALPLETYVRVNTTFDKDIVAGTSVAASSATMLTTIDVASGSSGLTVVDRLMGTYSSVDVAYYVQCKTSGATCGNLDIWQAYLPVSPQGTATLVRSSSSDTSG